ncbi:Hypothetical protein NTJ_09418 [Nesidiocoris tenuis]|uniref:Uncharacterized protein n=1 Tax=Nesidiocoris tenuis TaxID=355587 RepID=A0ABN7AWP1_9HEMI|nr:Hypothetical protein NTJ_09418 [Nesidiocoris tenuis]
MVTNASAESSQITQSGSSDRFLLPGFLQKRLSSPTFLSCFLSVWSTQSSQVAAKLGAVLYNPLGKQRVMHRTPEEDAKTLMESLPHCCDSPRQ